MVRIASSITQQNAPSWGLGRISHKQRGNTDYVYNDLAGQGITIYGIDTGIDIKHPEFEGRATWGLNAIDDKNTDGAGHGTHTAGTFAGAKYGIAKKAKIIAVKVLDDSGSGRLTTAVQGMVWAVSHAKEHNLVGKAVMNLSLGTPKSKAVNDAAINAQNAGIFVTAAAGNFNASSANPYKQPSSPLTIGIERCNERFSSFRRNCLHGSCFK